MAEKNNKVISLFHSKLNDLRQKFPELKFKAVDPALGAEYELEIDDSLSFYFNYNPEDLKKLDDLAAIIKIINGFNSVHKNLKVFVDDSEVVWCNYDTLRTPLFTSFTNYDSEKNAKKFKELDEKAEFVLNNRDYFICSHCHFVKNKKFMFSAFINGNTCVSCQEIEYE